MTSKSTVRGLLCEATRLNIFEASLSLWRPILLRQFQTKSQKYHSYTISKISDFKIMNSMKFVIFVFVGFLVMVTSPLERSSASEAATSFRQFRPDDDMHVCSIYIYTDPFLWRQVYKMEGRSILPFFS